MSFEIYIPSHTDDWGEQALVLGHVRPPIYQCPSVGVVAA
jgi:hypothetical protein